MNFFDSFAPADELPLERPVPVGGGMCSIFRTIGCVGDSLASGEFEVRLPAAPDGNRLGQVVTNTYVRAAAQDGIWTVMIAVPERDLDEITSRYNEKVEKPAHVEIVTPAGKRVISQDAGLRLFGGSSRTLEQKSFKLIAHPFPAAIYGILSVSPAFHRSFLSGNFQ